MNDGRFRLQVSAYSGTGELTFPMEVSVVRENEFVILCVIKSFDKQFYNIQETFCIW